MWAGREKRCANRGGWVRVKSSPQAAPGVDRLFETGCIVGDVSRETSRRGAPVGTGPARGAVGVEILAVIGIHRCHRRGRGGRPAAMERPDLFVL